MPIKKTTPASNEYAVPAYSQSFKKSSRITLLKSHVSIKESWIVLNVFKAGG